MYHRKTYLNFFLPAVLCGIYLIVRLFGQIIHEQRQEQTLYLLNAEVSSGEIPEEILEEMTELPGFCRMWMCLSAEVEIFLDDYHSGGKLTGVDLESYPMKITGSGGQKAVGTKPLMVIGEDFLKGMKDQNEKTISTRQAEILTENIGTMKIALKPEEEAGKEGAEKGKKGAHEAEILGITKGGGLYMDAARMRTWLSDRGIFAGISGVCMEIRGKSHSRSAKKSLEEAGFSCYISEAESSVLQASLSSSSGVR